MVQKTVLVTSLKGGTGKTFIACNLALKLVEKGYKVGLIDSDIDSSNVPDFLGIKKKIIVTEERKFVPVKARENLQVFAMRAFVEDPISMSGEEYSQIVRDISDKEHTSWDCDYFVIDTPSGASSIYKQVVGCFIDSLVGCVIVGHPAHPKDVKDTCEIARFYEIPIIGLIENLSGETFGENSLEGIAKEFNTPFHKIPLLAEIRENNQKGKPLLKGTLGKPIIEIVRKIETLEPEKVGIVKKIKKRVKEFEREVVIDLLAFVIEKSNTELDVGAIKKKYGLRSLVARLTITNEEMTKVYTSNLLRLTDEGLRVLKEGEEKIHIEMSFATLARSGMGEQRDNGGFKPFDPIEAWRFGEVKVSGIAATQSLYYFITEVFEGVKPLIREKFGKVLRRVI